MKTFTKKQAKQVQELVALIIEQSQLVTGNQLMGFFENTIKNECLSRYCVALYVSNLKEGTTKTYMIHEANFMLYDMSCIFEITDVEINNTCGHVWTFSRTI